MANTNKTPESVYTIREERVNANRVKLYVNDIYMGYVHLGMSPPARSPTGDQHQEIRYRTCGSAGSIGRKPHDHALGVRDEDVLQYKHYALAAYIKSEWHWKWDSDRQGKGLGR